MSSWVLLREFVSGTGEFVDGAAEGTRRDPDEERNVLQCVAVFCSALHCVAVCCSVLI